MRARAVSAAALLALLGAPFPALACPPAEAVARLADSIAASRPAQSLGPGLSVADGLCAQARVVERLSAEMGPPVGHKVGLTNPQVQQRFGVPHPVRGVLLRDMLKPSGATVPASFGAVPMFESDLLVVVRDAGVNDASDRLGVLRSLEAVVPFIELPDLVLAQGEHMDGAVLTAINVGARMGIVGERVPVQATQDFADRLAAMTVVATDDTGKELSRAPGAAVLGHPLDVVLWLAEDLRRTGGRLEAGDVVSLGSFSPLARPEPGRTVTVRYEGLVEGAAPEARVTFR
jgi:2-keto-4-pentenoate hydratase